MKDTTSEQSLEDSTRRNRYYFGSGAHLQCRCTQKSVLYSDSMHNISGLAFAARWKYPTLWLQRRYELSIKAVISLYFNHFSFTFLSFLASNFLFFQGLHFTTFFLLTFSGDACLWLLYTFDILNYFKVNCSTICYQRVKFKKRILFFFYVRFPTDVTIQNRILLIFFFYFIRSKKLVY